MTKAEKFFYKNAGFSYDPKRQTPEQGQRETAARLAHAEATAKANGWYTEWEDDPHGGMYIDEDDDPDQRFYSAVLYDEDGKMLANLGGIDTDDMPYRRVVEAELALEALAAGH